jgi:serine/threonine protein kinase
MITNEDKEITKDHSIKKIASIIENRTGYKWLPQFTKHGTGSIILVFDTGSFPPHIACKIIGRPLEKRVLEIFLREIMRTLRVQGHPLVANVSYVVPIASKPVIFMRYYEQDLRTYMLKKKALDVDETLAIIIQVVKGLLYLKEQGFIAHQDLKPENILLENIYKRVEAGVPPQLCLRPRVADFGLANAWIEAGIPGGSNPYKAPEQFTLRYSKEKAKEIHKMGLFNPDVFALGIILTEMITSKHPSGLSSNDVINEKIARNSEFWSNWSVKGARIIDIQNGELKKLILRMLEVNALKRPKLEEVYWELIRILKNINFKLYEELEKLLAYYDEIAELYKETLSDIDILKQLLKLSKVPEYVKLCCSLGEVLATIDKDKYREKVVELSLKSIDTISRWKDKIKAEHVPPLFKKITDYEAHGHLMSYALDLMRKVLAEQDIENMINTRYDNYMKSLYLFDKASEAHSKGEYSYALQYLEEALKYMPRNTTLMYFKALFKYHLSITMNLNMCNLLKEVIEELEELCKLETIREEPKKTLEEVKVMYHKLCSSPN